MKKFFICLKKSVRTFKLRIEPSFLSHALRGEPFQIQDFVGGIQNRRHFVPTIFLHPNPISFSGGLYCTKFELILKAILMIRNTSVPRSASAPLCEAQSFPRMESAGNAKYKYGLGFAKHFSEERIRKTETKFFEIRQGF